MSANAFGIQGNTVAFSVTSSVHATTQVAGGGPGNIDYVITNLGPNTVYIAMAGPVIPSGAAPSVTAAIPTDGTPANGYPVMALSKETISGPPNSYFSMICASTQTATVHVTPGEGV